MSEYMTVPDLAKLFGVSTSWIYRHAKEWPHTRFGTELRFEQPDIDKIRALHRRTPATPTRRNIGTRKRKTQP
jgi:predicted DNA-binding transcriptional regulator AlpA